MNARSWRGPRPRAAPPPPVAPRACARRLPSVVGSCAAGQAPTPSPTPTALTTPTTPTAALDAARVLRGRDGRALCPRERRAAPPHPALRLLGERSRRSLRRHTPHCIRQRRAAPAL
jgi:hypothetical protein